jgi:myo-inositol-1(or 4)-monophosphatase
MALAMQAAGLQKIVGKSNETDLVTEADGASEYYLRRELGALLPNAGFWGEESNDRPAGGQYWLVDPIDGTVNFAHGLPYNAVNVALVESDASGGADVTLAVTVEMPWRRIFFARPGEGAFMREPLWGERRLQVSKADTLRKSLLATGFPYHSGENDDANDLEFAWFAPKCLGIRVLGAAAIDTAQVAAGMLAGFWEGWLNPWDCAAGALMVLEAGGKVTDYNGRPWHFNAPGFVASNGIIHDALIDGILEARTRLQSPLMIL